MSTFRWSLLLCFSMFCVMVMAEAQSAKPKAVILNQGLLYPEENFNEFRNSNIPAQEIYNGHYYRLLQFKSLPDQNTKRALANLGVQLLDYIPHHTYIASLPADLDKNELQFAGIRSVFALTSHLKMTASLQNNAYPEWSIKKEGMIDLKIRYYDNIPFSLVNNSLWEQKIAVLQSNEYSGIVWIRVRLEEIEKVAELPFVFYVEPMDPPGKPEDTRGRSFHRANVVNSEYGAGRHFDGTGVTVALNDDGFAGPHIDFKGRTDQSEVAGDFGGNHGDMTGGILTGAGNLDPTIQGMAPGAFMHVRQYDATMPGTVDLHQNNDVMIFSTSYSNGCNAGYTATTEQMDQEIVQNPSLIQVFSAGNSNGFSDCGYGAGVEWGNITGGHKAAKNVITVGNLNDEAVLNGSSSRGPISDGRIKPDICAYGDPQMSTDSDNEYQVGGGTSAAAPGIAGVTTQLYHAFKDMNGGDNPESSLIKACLLNTAYDLGNPGPDFMFGWGRVNAARALTILENGQFLEDNVDNGSSNTHTITIPSGVKELRIMAYWMDPEGTPLSGKALVNDLDMQVTEPGVGPIISLPLVLNHFPDPDSLSLDAKQGVDTLNNQEQVRYTDPTPGNYTINITGTEVPMGPQKYYIVYEMIMDEIMVTYPLGGEGFAPGETENLRWDAPPGSGPFTLEYSTDNGGTYSNIATNVDGDLRFFNWAVPSTVSGQCLVRVSDATNSDESDAPFTILQVPTGLWAEWACPDSLKLSWNPVPGVSGYEVFQLGAKYMDSIGTTTLTEMVVKPHNPNLEYWFSVRALLADGGKGRRDLAYHKEPGTSNCELAIDVQLEDILSPTLSQLQSCAENANYEVQVQVTNPGTSPVTDPEVHYRLNGGTVISETVDTTLGTGESTTHTFSVTEDLSVAGTYEFETWVSFTGDLNIYNDSMEKVVEIISSPLESLIWTEDFESGTFLPNGWYMSHANDGDGDWQTIPFIPGLQPGDTSTVAYFNNFAYNNPGAEDAMNTVRVDLTSAIDPVLEFDVSYAQFTDNFSDGLRVDVSTDCGQTFVFGGYNKIGFTLATAPNSSSWFFPDGPDDWRHEMVNLSNFKGNVISLKFVNINDFGNNILLDNIFISDTNTVSRTRDLLGENNIRVFPNPSNGQFTLSMDQLYNAEISYVVSDLQGRRLQSWTGHHREGNFSKTVDLSGHAHGIYILTMDVDSQKYFVKLAVE